MLLFVMTSSFLSPAVFRKMSYLITVITFNFGHIKSFTSESRVWIIFLDVLLSAPMRGRSSPSSFEFG